MVGCVLASPCFLAGVCRIEYSRIESGLTDDYRGPIINLELAAKSRSTTRSWGLKK
jgi:hypothetical protein